MSSSGLTVAAELVFETCKLAVGVCGEVFGTPQLRSSVRGGGVLVDYSQTWHKYYRFDRKTNHVRGVK